MNQVEELFAPIEGAQAVLLIRGIYSTAPLHTYRDRLYAKVRGGFVLLKAAQLTSSDIVSWRSVEGVRFTEAWDGLHIESTTPVVKTTARHRGERAVQ